MCIYTFISNFFMHVIPNRSSGLLANATRDDVIFPPVVFKPSAGTNVQR